MITPNTMQVSLQEFNKKFGAPINDAPTMDITPDQVLLRCNLILEETIEFIEASGIVQISDGLHIPKSFKGPDLIGVADAIADLLYVVFQAAVVYGIDAQAVFEEVHRSNMSKVWEDGTVHLRADGKILKPPTYSPAKILEVLAWMRVQNRQQKDLERDMQGNFDKQIVGRDLGR